MQKLQRTSPHSLANTMAALTGRRAVLFGTPTSGLRLKGSVAARSQPRPVSSASLAAAKPRWLPQRSTELVPPAGTQGHEPLGPGGSAAARSLPAAPEEQTDLTILQQMQQAWDKVDPRKKIVLACSLGFVLSNMDKVNMTVAIIPMGLEMGWSPTTAGLVQSSFFYGFLLMQLPGGIFSSRFGGAFVLPRGVALWSAATAAIPFVAGNMPALCVTRSVMGMGEATAPSSIVDMISRVVSPAQRASSVSFAYGGLHVGTLVGLISSPVIINTWGWPSLFYTFGLAGALWLLWFNALLRSIMEDDPELAAQLQPLSSPRSMTQPGGPSNTAMAGSHLQQEPARQYSEAPIPYRAFLRSPVVRALAFTHFVHNWMHYTMLSWLPTYLVSTLEVDLSAAAQTALLPPLAGIAASACAGALGDSLLRAGVPTPWVRKVAQSIGFLAPTAFLLAATQVPATPDESSSMVAFVTAALGLCSFSLAGLYCTHQDLSPKYASVLMGLTNVAGSLPGVIGVASVGILYDCTGNWNLALFAPSCVLMLLGTAVYCGLVTHDPIDFDSLDNSEFKFETHVRAAYQASPMPKVAAAAARTAALFGDGAATLEGAVNEAWATFRSQHALLQEWVREQRHLGSGVSKQQQEQPSQRRMPQLVPVQRRKA